MASPSWLDELPRLSGSLVHVREVALSDAPVLYELLSEPRVTQHLSGPPASFQAFQGFVRWAHRQRSAGNGVTFGIVPTGLRSAVGIVQVRALEPTWIVAEWGFALGVAFWGTGVFSEAAELVARFAFDHLNVQRLEARVVTSNGRASGALNKMGASAEVTLARSFKRPDGTYSEQLLWSLRAEDWRQRGLFDVGRFSPDAAKRRIAAVVSDVQQLLRDRSARATNDDSPEYPFLLTRNVDHS